VKCSSQTLPSGWMRGQWGCPPTSRRPSDSPAAENRQSACGSMQAPAPAPGVLGTVPRASSAPLLPWASGHLRPRGRGRRSGRNSEAARARAGAALCIGTAPRHGCGNHEAPGLAQCARRDSPGRLQGSLSLPWESHSEWEPARVLQSREAVAQSRGRLSRRFASQTVVMVETHRLPDGRVLRCVVEGADRRWTCWLEDRPDRPVSGWPLEGVIAEVVGFNPAHDELPDWVVELAARIAARGRS
jgi:hypothetical protein